MQCNVKHCFALYCTVLLYYIVIKLALLIAEKGNSAVAPLWSPDCSLHSVLTYGSMMSPRWTIVHYAVFPLQPIALHMREAPARTPHATLANVRC